MIEIGDCDINNLKRIIDYYIVVSKSITGEKLNGIEGLEYAKVLAEKTHSHISSAYNLLEGQIISENDGKYAESSDNSSIAVLLRAALESYLTLNYIFIAPKTDLEKEYRFHCWDLAGYIERKDFPAVCEENIRRKEEEARFIDKTLLIIKDFEFYQKSTSKQRHQIKKGNWKLNASWADLAHEARFDKKNFKVIYSYLCSYSHSGRLSALQIMQSNRKSDRIILSNMLVTHMLIVLSKCIFDYVNLIPMLKIVFDSSEDEKWIVKLYKDIGEGLKNDH